ncbi:Ribulose-5-phosphate 4-epimerase and related epimerases and aldolases [Olavius algarvensis associated proteobacterium Delta 3]|nr:Ribulose-5-phosphate 4-epimerase and related epimerases and aldolases [Olavius algarvensis associated proteobacterium Delta 3]
MSEKNIRQLLVTLGSSLAMRGYSPGSSGNISIRLEDGFLMTPTNSRLGMLDPDRISRLDPEGAHIAGDKPSKEVVVHLAVYRERPRVNAVVHLHSPWCMAVSCLPDLPPENALPPLTPYYAMRFGALPVIPYFRPADPELAREVGRKAATHHAMLLAQHGMIVGGKDLDDAVNSAEELEETARLFFQLKDRPYRKLTREQVSDLERVFPRNL